MRVLIDYRPALRARSGVGEYVHELTRALVEAGAARGWSFSVFTSSWKDRPPADLSAELGGAAVIDRRIPGKLLNLSWHRAEYPPVEWMAAGPWDVVHSAHPLLIPTRTAAQVITIHDVDFVRHPEWTRGEIRRDYGPLAGAHAARADAVVTSSHASARDIERTLKVAPDRISVCPAGAPDWSNHAGSLPPGIPADPYILFLGTLEARKNLGTLLDAYERVLADRTPATRVMPLVVAGAPTSAAQSSMERAARAPLAGNVVFTGYVASESRRLLYERAAMFVLPSHHEGFGLPVLEAMSLGVPVIASDRGSLPEVLGDTGILIDPDDAGSLATAIRRMAIDQTFADRCRARGLDRARQFSWRSSAEILIDAYERAADRRRRR